VKKISNIIKTKTQKIVTLTYGGGQQLKRGQRGQNDGGDRRKTAGHGRGKTHRRRRRKAKRGGVRVRRGGPTVRRTRPHTCSETNYRQRRPSKSADLLAALRRLCPPSG